MYTNVFCLSVLKHPFNSFRWVAIDRIKKYQWCVCIVVSYAGTVYIKYDS